MDKKLTAAEKSEFFDKLNQQMAISSMQEMLTVSVFVSVFETFETDDLSNFQFLPVQSTRR